ncbi:MAG: heme lyase CcmF/NrfE family subunit [Rickettsiales bacterium]
MIPELGHFALLIALGVALLNASSPLLLRTANHLVKPAVTLQFMLVLAAFLALIHCYVVSDFSVLNVVENSHSAKPLLYKITGVWGNHEGSMLLWMLVLSFFGFLVAFFRAEEVELKRVTLHVHGLISAGFLAFILFTSNPFWRIYPPAFEGQDLNPLLQDIGLAFHPPTLYVGYVGYGIVFAYAIAGLLRGTIDSAWARAVKPWLGITWAALTLGIGAGSWWAYRELGWGGWWFWDPVENVSLMPWLAGGALLHANLVLERRNQMGKLVVLLAILTFSLSLIGTFIVRSGLITSVHAFASDPLRGLYILGYIVLITGGGLTLYAWRQLPASAPISLVSRTGFILLNNILLLTAAGTILLATLYPLILELLGLPPVSVGPPYFNTTFLPLTAPLLILCTAAPLMAWDGTTKKQRIALLKAAALPVLGSATIVLLMFQQDWWLFLVGLTLGALLLVSVGRYSASNLQNLSLRHVASVVGHTGLAIFAIAITVTSLSREVYEVPRVGSAPMQMGDYTVTPMNAEQVQEHNYITRRGVFEIRKGDSAITLTPEIRYYPVRDMNTSEAALHSTPLRDIYVVMGESGKDGVGIRMYVTPLQQWVWYGFVLIGISGGLSFIAGIRRRS